MYDWLIDEYDKFVVSLSDIDSTILIHKYLVKPIRIYNLSGVEILAVPLVNYPDFRVVCKGDCYVYEANMHRIYSDFYLHVAKFHPELIKENPYLIVERMMDRLDWAYKAGKIPMGIPCLSEERIPGASDSDKEILYDRWKKMIEVRG